MAMAEEQLSGNPFHPGTGLPPEHLAGREPEQALLKGALDMITGPRKGDHGPLLGRAPQPLKIVGPRGVGKTVLLAWTKSVVNPEDADVVSLADLPHSDSGEAFSEFLSELANVPGFDLKKHGETQAYKYIQMALNWQPGQPSVRGFRQILRERLQIRPLLLLLDEVMHYDADMLGQLLRHGRLLMSKNWPLAIVLAGTPALEAHLDDVDATFIDRAEDVYINALKPTATRTALSHPFADRGVKVSDEALKLMLNWTDDYPFFIQTVGSEVWKAKENKGRKEVDLALVQSAEQAIQDKRDGFYKKIFRRIENAGLLEHAMKAVAAIDAAPKLLPPGRVRDYIAEGTDLKHKGTLKIYNKLLDAGLYWELSDNRVRAAIPSFFTYFKEEYKQRHA